MCRVKIHLVSNKKKKKNELNPTTLRGGRIFPIKHVLAKNQAFHFWSTTGVPLTCCAHAARASVRYIQPHSQ